MLNDAFFDSSTGYWLRVTSRAYENAMNQRLQPEGITFQQCQVLGWLALKGVCYQSELAEWMRVEPPTLVRILDRMEREDWISRSGTDSDRRRKMITPTKKAGPVWDRITKCAIEVRSHAMKGISQKDAERLKELLIQVRGNLEEYMQNGAISPDEMDGSTNSKEKARNEASAV